MNTALWPANILVINLNSTNLSWGSAVETDTAVVKPPFWPASSVYLLYAIHIWWWWNIFHVKKYTENRENHWNLDRSNLLSTAATTHNILRFNLQNWTNTHHRSGKIFHRFYINEVSEKRGKHFFKKVQTHISCFRIVFFFFFWCCSPLLTQVLLTFHEHLFGAICALHCGASVSVNSALQHHLVCTLTFWSVLNFGTPSAATYGGGGGGVPLVCEVRPTSNTSDYKSGLQRPDLTTMALDFVGGGIKKINKSMCTSYLGLNKRWP